MRFVCAVLVSLFVVGSVFAQAPAPSGPVVPALDELDQALIQNVRLAQQLFDATCAGLPMRAQVQTLCQQTVQKIETRHPGFTTNCQTFVLVPKPGPVTR